MKIEEYREKLRNKVLDYLTEASKDFEGMFTEEITTLRRPDLKVGEIVEVMRASSYDISGVVCELVTCVVDDADDDEFHDVPLLMKKYNIWIIDEDNRTSVHETREVEDKWLPTDVVVGFVNVNDEEETMTE